MSHAQIDDNWSIRISLSSKHNIIQFDVPMENALRVQVVHSSKQIFHQGHHTFPVEFLSIHKQLGQRPLVIFLHDVDGVFGFVDSFKSTDIFMGALCQDLELLKKSML